MAWTDLTFSFGAVLTSTQMTQLDDNFDALAAGSSGAPKISNTAFSSTTLGAEKFQTGTTERDWVMARYISASSGAVGTYGLMQYTGSDTSLFHGETVSGSTIEFSDTEFDQDSVNPSGTWRCMGKANGNTEGITLFLRIS